MNSPGPSEKRDEIELIALRELPTAAVAFAVLAALATKASETAIYPFEHSLAFVSSPFVQVHPSRIVLQFTHPSLGPVSQISSPT